MYTLVTAGPGKLPTELLVRSGGPAGAISERCRDYWDDVFLGSEPVPDKYPIGTMLAVFTRGGVSVYLAFPETALFGGAEFFRTLEQMARTMYTSQQ